MSLISVFSGALIFSGRWSQIYGNAGVRESNNKSVAVEQSFC
jgi:hypothetical protein